MMNTRLIELLKELRPDIKDIGIFENDIKEVSYVLNLTYKNLGNKIGYGESAINCSATGKVSKQLSKALELYVETLLLKKKLDSFDTFKNTLKVFLTQVT